MCTEINIEMGSTQCRVSFLAKLLLFTNQQLNLDNLDDSLNKYINDELHHMIRPNGQGIILSIDDIRSIAKDTDQLVYFRDSIAINKNVATEVQLDVMEFFVSGILKSIEKFPYDKYTKYLIHLTFESNFSFDNVKELSAKLYEYTDSEVCIIGFEKLIEDEWLHEYRVCKKPYVSCVIRVLCS